MQGAHDGVVRGARQVGRLATARAGPTDAESGVVRPLACREPAAEKLLRAAG